jgi:hypothetical protein
MGEKPASKPFRHVCFHQPTRYWKGRRAAEIRRQRQPPGQRQFFETRRDFEGLFLQREVVVPRLDIPQQRLIGTARTNHFDCHLPQ